MHSYQLPPYFSLNFEVKLVNHLVKMNNDTRFLFIYINFWQNFNAAELKQICRLSNSFYVQYVKVGQIFG